MPKKITDSIESSGLPERKSIRDIPVPDRRRSYDSIKEIPKPPHGVERRTHSVESESQAHVHTAEVHSDIVPIHKVESVQEDHLPRLNKSSSARETRTEIRSSKPRSRKGLWIGTILVILALAFSVLSFFSCATLAYTPASVPMTFSGDTLTASKSDGSGLLFSVVKLSKDAGKSVPATGTETATEKAHGTIIVYNEADTAPQKLVKNTRFETADGKVYRVGTDIAVPGKSGTTPGSLEITVTADQAGPDYNIGLTDFTLPGLKGDARYATIYARSKTAMTGGFSGTRSKISESDLASARNELEAGIKAGLLQEVSAQAPADYVIFPDLATITYTDLPQTDAAAGNVTFNLEGTIEAVMFKSADLSNYIAAKKISTGAGMGNIADFSNLSFAFASGTPNLDNATTIDLTANGNATLILLTDEAALKNDLRGVKKDKESLNLVLSKYQSIETADATIRPFWRTSFPKNADEITVKKLSSGSSEL